MYRVGIIGCGSIGCGLTDNHRQAYLDCYHDGVRLVALCDKDKERADVFRDFCNAIEMTTDNYLDMVRQCQLDIVSVCTPPETHCQIVCDIAPYVKAIYCEKPIALTLEDADKMIKTCHENNVILQINHQRRFTRPRFRFSRGILNTGTHAFDLVRQLFRVDVRVEMEYVDIDAPIFELDCTHNKEPMILKGVEHLLDCLENNKQSISSGEEARKTLEVVLDFANSQAPNHR